MPASTRLRTFRACLSPPGTDKPTSVIPPHEQLPLPHPERVTGLTRAPASPGSPAVHELADAQLPRPGDGLGAVGRAELAQDMADMCARRGVSALRSGYGGSVTGRLRSRRARSGSPGPRA